MPLDSPKLTSRNDSKNSSSAADSTSSSSSRSSSQSSSSESASVPRYADTMASTAPLTNYSEVSRTASNRMESARSNVSRLESSSLMSTMPETSSASVSEGEVSSSTETEESTEDSSETSSEGEGESSIEGDARAEESEGGSDEEQNTEEQQEGDEEQEDEAEQEGGQEEAEQEEEGSITMATSSESGSASADAEPLVALAAALPRLARIQTPYIASPPKQAIERRDQIIKKTGSPPELHHAQVRQAAENVTQCARDAQRRMINRIGILASDTRISVEDMADEIGRATHAAIAQINTAVDTAMCDIETASVREMEHIDAVHVKVGEEAEAARDQATLDIYNQLREGSAKIQEAEFVADEKFTQRIDEAEPLIGLIPHVGKVDRIPVEGGSSEPSDAEYQTIAAAEEALQTFFDAEKNKISGGYENTSSYIGGRAQPYLTSHVQNQSNSLQEAAEKNVEKLRSPASFAQFMTMVLSLTVPVSQYHEEDQSGAQDQEEDEGTSQMNEVARADMRAKNSLREKAELAKEYCNLDLRENLVDNLRKSGRKAQQAMMQQARQAEIGLNSSTAPMAEDYRDLIARLETLLAPGKFLNAEEMIPRIMEAKLNAEQMLLTHEGVAEAQAKGTVDSLDKVKKDQIESLAESAQKSVESTRDIVTRTAFDMSLFSSQMTGSVSAGAQEGIASARTYAEGMTQGILSSNEKVQGEAMEQVDTIAANYCNSHIDNAERSQFQSLENFVKQMTGNDQGGENSPLVRPMNSDYGKLSDAAEIVNSAMPDPNYGTMAAAGGAMMFIPGAQLIGGVVLASELYHSIPDGEKVVTTLGPFVHPGVPAIGEIFEHRQAPFVNMQDMISRKLSGSNRQAALSKFGGTAQQRGADALELIEDSTNLITGLSAEAREALAQGISQEEYDSFDRERLHEVCQTITDELDSHEEDIALAYLSHNRERAVAARTRRKLDEADDLQWGWIFSGEEAERQSSADRVKALQEVESDLRTELTIEQSYISPEQLRESTGDYFQEMAFLNDPNHNDPNHAGADQFTEAQGRQALTDYATQDSLAIVLGPNLDYLEVAEAVAAGQEPTSMPVQSVSVSEESRDYIDALVNVVGTDADSEERMQATSAGQVYVASLVEGPGRRALSPTEQTLVTDQFENLRMHGLERELLESDDPNMRRLMTQSFSEEEQQQLLATASLADRRRFQDYQKELTRYHQILQMTARSLGAENYSNPIAAQQFMARRVGSWFARSDSIFTTPQGYSHRSYGEELINHGRASMEAGVALATEGLGTHDDLLRRSYSNRTATERQQANERWGELYGGDMDEFLGVKDREWDETDHLILALSPAAWLATRSAETSGDLTMELREESVNDGSDLGNLRASFYRHRHTTEEGTGLLGTATMFGSAEDRAINDTNEALAQLVLDEAARHNSDAAARFQDNPTAIFLPDGSIDPAIHAAAFTQENRFRGDRTLFDLHRTQMRVNSTAYRNELARQESVITTAITVLALIATVAAMLIPGANAVVAGIAVAIIAGTSTMLVKAGMRGERYGWEEAAVDAASMAVEAASAGMGGALGKVSAFGRLGKVGGAMAREAISSALSSGAQVALQDSTWQDGFDKGLENIASGALRNAAVSAITAGVAEGVTNKMTKALSPGQLGADELTGLQRLGGRLGPHGSAAVAEATGEFFGTAVGESVGLTIDHARGTFKGGWADAFKAIGQAAVRDMAVGAFRGAVNSYNKSRYQTLLDQARNSDNVSPEQLKALRLAGISAGVFDYGDNPSKIMHEVSSGREALARLPTGLREQAARMDTQNLKKLLMVMEHGFDAAVGAGLIKGREDFLQNLHEDIPGFNGHQFMKQLDLSIAGRARAKEQGGVSAIASQRLRAQLSSRLSPDLQGVLDRSPMEGLEHLSSADMHIAADMIRSGVLNAKLADGLFARARKNNPELDEATFLNSLMGAVKTSQEAQVLERKLKEQVHTEVMSNLDEDGREVLSGLPHEQIVELKTIFDSQVLPSPHERTSLLEIARRNNPELSDAKFQKLLEIGIARTGEKQQKIREAARSQREQQMLNIPKAQRGILSALPTDALLDLRVRQQQGEALSPHEVNRLLDAALRETPDVDLQAVEKALHQAMENPQQLLSPDHEAKLRQELLGAIPKDQQGDFDGVPILVMRDGEFEAFTRSQSGQAVTLIIHGHPVVVMRESADPSVLREEGIHVLQSKDPEWADRVRELDESKLANWDQLSIAEQLSLYRSKVDLELDAQQRLVDSLQAELAGGGDPQTRAQLQTRLQLAEASLGNLIKRAREVASLSGMDTLAMASGDINKPQWLDQPARLFNKENTNQQTRGSPDEGIDGADVARREPPSKDELEGQIKTTHGEIKSLDREGLLARLEQQDIAADVEPIADLLRSLPADTDIEVQRKLVTMALLMREAGMNAADFSRLFRMIDAPNGASDLAIALADRLPNLDRTKESDTFAKERKTFADRLVDLAKMQPALEAMDAMQFASGSLKGDLKQMVFGETTLLDAVWGRQRSAVMGRLDKVAKLSSTLSETQLQRLVDRRIRPKNFNAALGPLISFLDSQGRQLTPEGLSLAVGFFFANVRDFNAMVDSIDKLQQVLGDQDGGAELVTDALKAAAFMKQTPNMIILLTHIASAIGRHQDADKLFASFDTYIKAAAAGEGNLDLLSSLQRMGSDILKASSGGQARLNESMIDALTNKTPLSGSRPTPKVDADLKRPPAEFSADTNNKQSREFVEKWHKFMMGTFSPDGYNRDFTVSDSYKKFFEFLVHKDGFSLPLADVEKALQRVLAEAASSGKALTVDDVRHGFKDQFKDQIMRWVLYNNPKAKLDEVDFDASNPEQVKESLKRLEALSTHGLNVKDRGNFAEAWYAAYKESLSGSELDTQPILREEDNKAMLETVNGVEVPSTKSQERKPDFADPPALVDVKSHKGALSSDDDKRLRAYLRAVSQDGGAKVRMGGELSTEVFDRFRLVFTNAAGAVSSSSRLKNLLEQYSGHFSIVIFNPHTGQRHEVDHQAFSNYKRGLDSSGMGDSDILKQMLEELSAPAVNASDAISSESDTVEQ